MTKTLSMLSITLGLLASACATGGNYPGATQARHFELVSFDTEDLVYEERCNACEQGVPQQKAPAESTGLVELSMFERLYPVHPLAPVHGVHEEPVTP